MRLENKNPPEDEMRSEYDIRGGVRGKYYERYKQGTNLVLLEPDVAEVFHDSQAVNRALRLLIDVARGQVGTSEEEQGPNPPLQSTGSARG